MNENPIELHECIQCACTLCHDVVSKYNYALVVTDDIQEPKRTDKLFKTTKKLVVSQLL